MVMPVTDRMKRGVYILVGTLALALGALGFFLPVLPTTPFVILAAACYYRGSERLHAWLLESRWFGEMIRNYQAGRGITRSAVRERRLSPSRRLSRRPPRRKPSLRRGARAVGSQVSPTSRWRSGS